MYFYAAADFAAAADAYVSVYGRHADPWTTYYLLAKSFEIAVKAALIAHGVSRREISGLGHDLTAAVHLARARDIEVVDPKSGDTACGIEALSAAYASTELAYRERGAWSGPTPSLLREIVHLALNQAARYSLRPQVYDRLLGAKPARPGLTLDYISHYK